MSKSNATVASPPPHLTSFKNALYSDASEGSGEAPSLPPRRYEQQESTSRLYTVPESDLMPQADMANWDDSDAEERILKELQQNRGKEKLRQQQLKQQQQQQQQQQQSQQQHQQQQQPDDQDKKPRERKVTLAVPGDHNPIQSPKTNKSDFWRNDNTDKTSPPGQKVSESNMSKGDYKSSRALSNPVTSPTNLTDIEPSIIKPYNHGGPGFGKTSPFYVKDTEGKRYVFYFEEGSPHFVEVEDDDIGAFFPDKIEDIERLFRRVWREVFAILRVVTSFFVLFISELLRFLLHTVVRTLLLDTVAALGDHLLKPLLTVLFNAVLQPLFALTWNVFNAAYQALDPVMRLTGVVMSQVAMVLGAFRLFAVNYKAGPGRYNDVNVV
ncbi:hypothetical protein ElyMa_002465300 [Elysia marginata]|uniref:Uncharacterized protein n=1 Tax=Elysia marginata TaxID=1093978 RepID=A0AAV4GMN6_9GAST|nr:hypothetical protein ElyMa_002465300 [Elysia marginata]